MQRDRFVRELEKAADNIAEMPRHELQVMLRRAALMLRNIAAPPADDGWTPVHDSRFDGDDVE
jgi:hypothetical protein